MAFNQGTSSIKSKNQFSARMVSNKTQAMINWVHITDDFARRVCGVSNASEVTAAMATDKLPPLLNSDRVSVVITDMTAELEPIPVDEY